jgi:hypothetical protein
MSGVDRKVYAMVFTCSLFLLILMALFPEINNMYYVLFKESAFYAVYKYRYIFIAASTLLTAIPGSLILHAKLSDTR